MAGFTKMDDGYARDDTKVVVALHAATPLYAKADELHLLDPPENLAQATFHGVGSPHLTVFLYVESSEPFGEPPDLKAYRKTLYPSCLQAERLVYVEPTLDELIKGLFVFHPVLERDDIPLHIKKIKSTSKKDVLERLDVVLKNEKLTDQFGVTGCVVRYKHLYFMH
jgi:hypothetical protein